LEFASELSICPTETEEESNPARSFRDPLELGIRHLSTPGIGRGI